VLAFLIVASLAFTPGGLPVPALLVFSILFNFSFSHLLVRCVRARGKSATLSRDRWRLASP
jgi:hypothetical protein